jgi:hypothetical protein
LGAHLNECLKNFSVKHGGIEADAKLIHWADLSPRGQQFLIKGIYKNCRLEL